MKLVTDNVEIGRNDITYYSSFSYSLENDRVRKYYNEWKNKINDNLKKKYNYKSMKLAKIKSFKVLLWEF